MISERAYSAQKLGGYALFGFFGVIYGPVLMILFQTTVDVYQEHYLTVNTPVAVAAGIADADSADMETGSSEKAVASSGNHS